MPVTANMSQLLPSSVQSLTQLITSSSLKFPSVQPLDIALSKMLLNSLDAYHFFCFSTSIKLRFYPFLCHKSTHLLGPILSIVLSFKAHNISQCFL